MGWRRSNPNKKYYLELLSKDLSENAVIVLQASSVEPKREEEDQKTSEEKKERRAAKMKTKQEKRNMYCQNFGTIMWASRSSAFMI